MDCPICLQKIIDNDAARIQLLCSHAFHHDCITRWVLQHRSCPLCRAPIEADATEPGEAGAEGSDLMVTVILGLCLLVLVLYNAITLRVQYHLSLEIKF